MLSKRDPPASVRQWLPDEGIEGFQTQGQDSDLDSTSVASPTKL
jgi:hypothetical protein